MTPLVKWAGGKRELATEILSRFPPRETWNRYLEPFCGGCAVGLRVLEEGLAPPSRVLFSDVLRPLVTTYQTVQVEAARVAGVLGALAGVDYYTARTAYNQRTAGAFARSPEPYAQFVTIDADVAALFLFLNRRGFNGLHRVNASGEFNVPLGSKRRELHKLADLEAFARATEGVSFEVRHALEVIRLSREGDLLYLDPPYIPLRADSFVSYSAEALDHRALAEAIRVATDRGARVILSNSDTIESRAIFGFLKIETIRARRSVSASATARKQVKEIVACNW